MTKEKTQEELEEEEEEEDSEDTDGGSSPSSAFLPPPGANSKRSSRYNLEEIHIDGDFTSDSMSPQRGKKQWRTSIDEGFTFGSSWLKFFEANEMTPVMEKIGKPLVAEFLGTFFLTFVGVCVGCSGSTTADSGPVSTGLTVALVIMTIGHISGAHINPCVSIGFAIIGELKPLFCFLYIMAQIVGSTAAGIIAKVILLPESYIGGKGGMVLIPSSSGVGQAIAAEVVATFFLVFVILHTAADQAANILAPVAIGFVVIVNCYAVGGISGCCMNPARALGASIAGTGSDFVTANNSSVLSKSWMDNLWYLIGTLLGTALAGLTFRLITAKNPKYLVNCDRDCRRKQPPTKNENQFDATPGGFSESTDP